MIGFIQQCRVNWKMFCRSIKHVCFIALVAVLLNTLSYTDGYANDYYRAGLSAYFDRDYEQAKQQWLQGAKQGEAKSMFNLGLLHEQKRINGADLAKAEEWFTLAGKAGYAPADYHLALIIIANGGSQQRANELLKKAALNGFSPAESYLNGDDFSLPDAVSSVSASEQVDGIESSNNPEADNVNSAATLDVEKIAEDKPKDYLSEPWILSKKPSDWTIQLSAFSDELKVRTFIQDNELNDSAAYFLEKSNDKTLYKLIYGAYKTKEQANLARQDLPSNLQQGGPWLRSIESVQTLIKAQ